MVPKMKEKPNIIKLAQGKKTEERRKEKKTHVIQSLDWSHSIIYHIIIDN